MNLRIVKPVSITGDSDNEKSLNSNKKKKNNNEKIKIESQNPKNLTLNFKGNEIKITFNKLIIVNSKFIKLQSKSDLKNVDDVFNVSFVNDEVKLKFKGNKKSGTYIITFLEGAIQDRYGNIMDEFSVIFSTNNTLDNYKLRGKVFDLMTLQNLSNMYVFLYKLNENDIKKNISSRNIINNNKPEYFSKTSVLGYYSFENLSPGIYFLCAGEIDKENFVSDPSIYKYGFVPKFIKIEDKNNDFEQNVYVLKSLLNEFTITNESTINNKYIIETNDIIKEFYIDVKENLLSRYSKYSDLLKKSVKIVDEKKIEIDNNILSLISTDFLPCNLSITSVNDEKIKKDILLRFNNSTFDDEEDDDDDDDDNFNDSTKNKDNQEFEIKALSQDLSVDSIFDFNIITKKNVLSIDKSKFKIIISDNYNIVNKIFTDFTVIEEHNNIHIKTDRKLQDIIDDIVNEDSKFDKLNKKDINIVIFVDKEAITYSDFTKNKNNIFNFSFLRNFSSLNVSFKIKSDHFKLQLLNEKYEVIKEISDNLVHNRDNITFEKLKDGKYFLRYFYWNNKDVFNKKNIWNPGNINKNIPNDPVELYKKEILINSGSTNEKIIIE